jgi:MerR family transcriptional regulator, thiopeptide resistance regulator
MKQYSISHLAREFKLSRSTLLYYDSIGLLKATARTEANYRVYTENDYKRLQRICSLRSTGISLEHVREIIDSDNTSVTAILHKRINQINDEIQKLRIQQNVIVKLLSDEELFKSTRVITKEMWVALLKSTGLDENGMRQWHMEFENSMPEGHQDFLESLGFSAEEISGIRKQNKK